MSFRWFTGFGPPSGWAISRHGLLHCLQCWQGVSSVDSWYATTLDVQEILSSANVEHARIFVADVIESLDTVDRSILDCTLGRL